MDVIAFHGQAASGARLRADMGNPDWVTWAPDWQRYASADDFAAELGGVPVVLVGYSLGGDFIARLTRTRLSKWIRGIAVYESPVLSGPPRALPCPCVVIWNNYPPRTAWRRAGKAASIAAWNVQYPHADNLIGRHTAHVLYSWRPPFIRHAWDSTVNPLLRKLLAPRGAPQPPQNMEDWPRVV